MVGERAEDLEAIALEHGAGGVVIGGVFWATQDGVDGALTAALGIVLLESTNEDHHGAALRHGLAHEVSAHAAGLVVVHADVHQAVAVRRIGIVGQHLGSAGGGVEQVSLVGRIDRADRDTLHAFGEQVLDHAFLVADAFHGHEGLGIYTELLAGGLHAR